MENFKITGIQQVGVGTTDFRKSWDWFIKYFGFDLKILEDDTVAERMLRYTGGKAQKRHACIAANLNGGGGLEIWQYSERTPVSADKLAEIGDLGVWAAKLKCREIEKFHKKLSESGLSPSPVRKTPDGVKSFFQSDPYGNIFQILEDPRTFIRQKTLCGGVAGALIGVSDMERSIEFYREVLGYDIVRYDVTGVQEDWQSLPCGSQSFRRVLLARSEAPGGAFSGLFGDNVIELVRAMDREPVKLFEGRYWGDPGFIQVCFDVIGMDAFGRHCTDKGHPFTVDSCPAGEIFDMGDASGRFTYTEDPDGTLLEFVETYKVPVAKKLGWFIDMSGRNALKPLPKVLFKAMGLVSRERV